MKLTTVLYIMGASSLVAGAPQDDEEPEESLFPSFSRPTILPSFSVPSRSARPTPTGSPPIPTLSFSGLPSFSRPGFPSFTISIRPTPSKPSVKPSPSIKPTPPVLPTLSVKPTKSGRPSWTSPPKPTPTDDGDDDDDEE
ncbi:hypothetical protein K504DRAFT_59416 [Pleomassaria siparia CBS 279.74]|uniref:Uncharacterized protein n=1 Tax=Pleomassaria siparia CBS 279.74 TaxID=1314801 RepID=A0A6G1K1G8_9PLEO|nr:hypothetical protein K504DRAFT_59416 [Pleomassaria siparia CBS 279.74]